MKYVAAFCLFLGPAFADAPVIENVTATKNGATWRFDVTLSHPDTGRDHYADGWRVLDMQGNELGYRELFHPHVNEQPFTRSLSGITIPDGTAQVLIEARDNKDGWSGQKIPFTLP
ncbi:hypothetical protein E4Z66_14175 [Aliishimia ponticola]|uniref:Uncharacterized protein n=1 Tax=Aliishimia ponticola TaxID=2499833 RepID=A0A4V3XKA2_9RHOB|nr:hypothetical protein [Aliishimia ponticola]THH36193.1 hypothetical protein E4Z66_14175 [Aliishimia ponticola]